MISIHAPARGATNVMGRFSTSEFISIHAPARGATASPHLMTCVEYDFNPRSRKGSDNADRAKSDFSHISIHAPARGATKQRLSFQNELCAVQSTLPQGERQDDGIRGRTDLYISIHAPARGATPDDARYGGS